MKRIIVMFLGVLLLHLAACDEDDHKHGYLEYSYIDTVLAADTIQNSDLVRIVHVYPSGCNYLERFESREHGDTLALAVLYHFYYSDLPCAHGSGLDTTSFRLEFSANGAHYLSYRRSKTATVIQPVYVEQ
jgi:hypothetical protein